MNNTQSFIAVLSFIFLSTAILAEEPAKNDSPAPEQKKEEQPHEGPPPIGNFSLPPSQQPFGLFAFGGNIINKNQVQLFTFSDEFVGKNKLIVEVIPAVLFGVTDNFSVLLNFPFAPIQRDFCRQSAGIQDFNIQLEWAFWNKQTVDYQDQATLIANVTANTGSFNKDPPTGFGSPSVFIAATYTHMEMNWFAFAGEGAILTTSQHRNKVGDQFLYQCGFGRNFSSPEGWIYAWMFEIDGQYSKKNRFHGISDRNSGGSVIFATPSLWMSSNEILLQFGVSVPIAQNLFGKQRKFDYVLNFNFGWSFY